MHTPTDFDLAVIAREVAENAGHLIRAAFGTGFHVEEKSSPADLVTEVDRAAELLIRRELASAVPASSVQGEEFGSDERSEPIIWHIDPIDGTQNFVIGRPYFAVSIGIERDGQLVGGVVHDPIQGVSSWAANDRAWQNDSQLPSVLDHPGHLGVNTGQPFQGLRPAASDLETLLDALESFGMVRSPGSIAMQIADVAVGRSAAAIELCGAAPWDIAGGFALAKGTGCTIINLTDPLPGYGDWGSHSFLICRDAALARTVAPTLRAVLSRGTVPERFASLLARL